MAETRDMAIPNRGGAVEPTQEENLKVEQEVVEEEVQKEEPKEENPGQTFKYADGEYELPLTVLHAAKDEESSMGKYVQNPSVVIKDGEAIVKVTLTSSHMITAFQVENDGEFIDTKIVSENKDENTTVVVRKAIKLMDSAARKGLIHKNNASRQKARLTKKAAQ